MPEKGHIEPFFVWIKFYFYRSKIRLEQSVKDNFYYIK